MSNDTPQDDLIGTRELLALLGIAFPTLHRWRSARLFPEPVCYGVRRRAYWSRHAIRAWIRDSSRVETRYTPARA